jgi:hypothetical protein
MLERERDAFARGPRYEIMMAPPDMFTQFSEQGFQGHAAAGDSEPSTLVEIERAE